MNNMKNIIIPKADQEVLIYSKKTFQKTYLEKLNENGHVEKYITNHDFSDSNIYEIGPNHFLILKHQDNSFDLKLAIHNSILSFSDNIIEEIDILIDLKVFYP